MKFGKDFTNLTNKRVAEIAHVARENAYKNGMLFEQVSIRDWLKHIEKDVK